MEERKKLRMVPPENGWAYMICLGFIITLAIIMSQPLNFAKIFDHVLREEDGSDSIIPFITGAAGFVIAFSGPIVNISLRWLSLRQIAMMGAALYTVTWTIHIWIDSAYVMILTYGAANGFALGILQTSSYIVFDSYFVRKRVAAMGISMTVVCLCSIGMPYFVNYLKEEYGNKATIAILSILSGSTLIGTALYQPVERHLVPENPVKDIEMDMKTEQLEQFIKPENRKKKTLMKKIKSNISLFKKLTYTNICIGVGVGFIGDIYFSAMLQPLLLEKNLKDAQIATGLSIIPSSELISRLSIGILGRFLKIKSFHWYYAGMILTMIARFALMLFSDILGIYISLMVCGFARAWIYIFFPILIAEELPEENYARAFALSTMFNIFFEMGYTASTGIAKSITQTYTLSFYIITMSALIALIPWTIELFVIRPLKRNKK